MLSPDLKEKPAIIIAAFGSSRRGKIAIELFRQRLTKRFPDHKIFMAYTSAILRRKMGLPGLHETLAEVEAAGFRKVVVQPLHIFPGTEYQQMAETCAFFPGLRVFLSETLLQRWDFIKETLQVVEREFLPADQGLNIMALHGTPLAADPVNVTYIGLQQLVTDIYENVMAASIEGIPDFRGVLASIRQQELTGQYKRARIIPMMYLAGLHAEDDLMGEDDSWRSHLEDCGFIVDCPMIHYDGSSYFKGLAYYPEVIEFFITRIERAIEQARYY
jgi:sirohydrochlorin cobaltochelatase